MYMKKFKRLSFVLLLITTLFIGNFFVNAEDSTIKISNEGNVITYDGQSVRIGSDYSPHFPVKHYYGSNDNKNNNVYCISGLSVTQPAEGSVCSVIDGWGSTYQNSIGYAKYGVAKIIELIHGTGNFSTENYAQYYWTELIIQEYLGVFNHNDYPNINTLANSSTKIGKSGKTYLQILEEAKQYGQSAKDKPTLSSDQSTKELDFTLEDDGYYYTQPITIQTNGELGFATITNKKFIVEDQKDGTYRIKIASGDIAMGTRESFSVNAFAHKYVSYVKAYSCGEGVQDVATATTSTERISSDTITFRGGVTRENTAIAIRKFDDNNMPLAGATFLFQTAAQKGTNIGQKITSEGKYMPIRDLQPGTYYLSEISAPEGYNKINDVIEIIIQEDGKVYFNGELSKTHVLDFYNEPTKTKFSKISITDQKELPGATLRILGANKEPIMDENGKIKYEWISGEKPHYIEGLPVGKYYLQETIAPKGYILSSELVEFEVKGDGSITEVVMKNASEVKVPNTLSSKSVLLLFIGMFDVALGIGILLYVKKNKITE